MIYPSINYYLFIYLSINLKNFFLCQLVNPIIFIRGTSNTNSVTDRALCPVIQREFIYLFSNFLLLKSQNKRKDLYGCCEERNSILTRSSVPLRSTICDFKIYSNSFTSVYRSSNNLSPLSVVVSS